jgi:hypothetical protein
MNEDQCISAVRGVVPVLFCLHSSCNRVTEAGQTLNAQNDVDFADVTLS